MKNIKLVTEMIKKSLIENDLFNQIQNDKDYKYYCDRTPAVGKNITFTAGRFKNEPAKIIKPAKNANAWIVELEDKTKVMVFPNDINTIDGIKLK